MRAATAIIKTPNSAISFCPSIIFPKCAPSAAPPTPNRAKARAQGHLTVFVRA